MKALTIAIPTFNRNETLARNLPRLLAQIPASCRLVILDNASDVPVAETLQPLLAGYPELDVQVIRNAANVGATANIMRCFEVCTTEWLWVLGDDNPVLPEGVATALDHIARYPDATFINFGSPLFRREATAETRGLDAFVERLDHYGNIIFISASLYRVPHLRPRLRLGLHYAYTMVPQFVLLLVSLGDAGQAVLSAAEIVGWEVVSTEQHWSYVNYLLGVPIFLDLPLSAKNRKALARRLIALFRKRDVFITMLRACEAAQDDESTRYYFDQVVARFFYYEPSLLGRLELLAYRMLMLAPTATLRFIQARQARKGYTTALEQMPDRFARM